MSEPNEIDKARKEFLVGLDGRTFNDVYLKPLNLSKSQVCVMDLTRAYLLNPEIHRYVIALGRNARKALGAKAGYGMPHPNAVRRFGDSGEVARKIRAILKHSGQLSLDAEGKLVGYLQATELCEDSAADLKSESRCESSGSVGKTSDGVIESPDRTGQEVPDESEENNRDAVAKTLVVPIIKAIPDKQIVYGVVLDPYQIDAQNDVISPQMIEETAHQWMVDRVRA